MTEQIRPGVALPPLAGAGASADEKGRAIEARILARAGVTPSVADYRRVYERHGLQVDDDTIRARHLVADSAA